MKKLVLIGGIAVVIFAGAWYLFLGGGNSSPILGGGNLNPDCEHNDPDLCKFLNNDFANREFSIQSVSTGGGQPSYEVLMDISGDSSHMIMKEGSAETWNQIYIGDITYSKDFKDNVWWKYTYKDEEENLFTTEDFDFTERLDGGKQTYTAVGKEACGNLTCFKYQMITPEMSDEEYILFDDKQYKLRITLSKSREGSATKSVYTYGKVSVRAPSPTKEAKSLTDLYGGMPGMPDVSGYDLGDYTDSEF